MGIFPENMAIVGNGPSEAGTKNGKLIDSFDKVLRFNNYKLLDKFVEDYGTRTDYWCHNLGGCALRTDQAYEKVFIIFPLHHKPCVSPIHLTDVRWNVINHYEDINVFIPAEHYTGLWDLMKKIDKGYNRSKISTSAGINMLYWIYKEQSKIISRGYSF